WAYACGGSMERLRWSGCLVVASAWLSAACGGGSASPAGRQVLDPGATAAGASGGQVAPSPATAPQPSNTAANPTAPIVPATPTTPAATCRPGHYVGTFSGDYLSGALAGIAEITFATSDVDSRPGFEFWLEAVGKACEPGQEFCGDVVVKGGKLRGHATPFEDANDPNTEGGLGFSVRFEIDLTGELDCQAKKFKGNLVNGCYDVFSVLYRFDGTIEGDYDTSTSSFPGGIWQVAEQTLPGALPPAMPLGGDGVWAAAYVDDSAPPVDGEVGLCVGMSGFDTQP
ncbi:MAG: hypothetical protein ABW321_27055, partial [Polyangiales bacterium]